MDLPRPVSDLISRLEQAGFSAYAVGGCVRDTLLSLVPHDWDLCTSARPEEMMEVFRGEHVVETGLKHGTLTVVLDHIPYEITTFRTDGSYTDHRHPDSVTFVEDVSGDLSRRDFTVNAMAYSPHTGLVDLFGGQEDLDLGVIRCVGVPEERFREDALRILRALRFAAVFDFAIDPETEKALRLLAPSLSNVAAERIREEFFKLLCGPGAGRILRAFPDVLAHIVPEISVMVGYDQLNHHHSYDLWEHTVQGLENVPADPDLRLTMLLHDTGKPAVRVMDDKGEAHYRGHQAASAEIAERVTDDLRCDRETRDRVIRLVRYHDIPLRTESGEVNLDRSFLLRRLNKFGEKDLRALFLIHRADRIATGYSTREKEDRRMAERMAALDALLAEQPCFTLKDLAVNGNDLKAFGLKGPALGEALQQLLEAVMDGKVANEKDALNDFVTKFIKI
ncbi:MAG: HD domain-containing protein [Clostridia bacterium]|nr:HD domain-containing protein [Clostridia bacterium]